METCRVSVLIVSWNSALHLPRCLDALQAQSFRDFEVILVDNGSTDACTHGVEARWTGLRLTVRRLEHNTGYAAANNLAARLAGGEWLALLNADAFPEPDWLDRLLHAAREYPDFSSFASRLLRADAPAILDGEGDVLHVSGLAWRRNHGRQVTPPGDPREVFSACGAAALLRRDVFLAAGGFDENYFSYQEDVDLGFRLRLAGQRCLFVPTARVHHVGTVSYGFHGDLSIYYGHRNLVWTFIKNFPGVLLFLFLPAHLAMSLSYLLYFSFTGQARPFLRARVDALRRLPRLLLQRRAVQRARCVSLWQVLRSLDFTWLPLYWAARLGDR